MGGGAHGDFSLVFIELGVAVLGLAVLARLAGRLGFSAIPLYLLAGLAFGKGGIAPIRFGEEFVRIGAEVGVVLLLFMLGLEYSGEKLIQTLRSGYRFGLIDLLFNFPIGVAAGLLLHFGVLPSLLLGGVTYISSSGVVAKVLGELKRMDCPETPTIVTTLVLEDLAMAVYLPIVGVLLTGQTATAGLISVGVALATVVVVLLIAVRFGPRMSTFVERQSDEGLLLTTLGLILLVAGITQRFQVSAAIGAFLVGVAVSGPMVKRAERLLSPLRDLFAAVFFLFFGLEIDPHSLPPVLGPALILGVATALTKLASGWWSARIAGMDKAASLRAGTALIARGEFSIVIAGLGAMIEPTLGALSAAYVLFMAVLGPLVTRFVPSQAPSSASS